MANQKARFLRKNRAFLGSATQLLARNQIPQRKLKRRMAGVFQVAVEVGAVLALHEVAEGTGVAQIQAHAVVGLVADAGHVAQLVAVQPAHVALALRVGSKRRAAQGRCGGGGGFVVG